MVIKVQSNFDNISSRILSLLEDSLIKNSFFLISDGALSIVLGFLFWVLAARLYTPGEIGLNNSAISTISLLVSLSGLGLGSGLIRYLPEESEKSNSLIDFCITISSLILMCSLIALYFFADKWSADFGIFLHKNFHLVVVFSLGYLITGILDNAIIAWRIPRYLVLKNIILNLSKLILLVLLSFYAFNGIFSSWGYSILIVLFFECIIIKSRINKSYRPSLTLNIPNRRDVIIYSANLFVADFLSGLPIAVMPIIMIRILDPKMVGYFSIIWMIINSIIMVSRASSVSLFAEGSRDMTKLNKMVLKISKFNIIQIIPIIVIVILISDRVLLLFGKDYLENGQSLLIILSISLIPYSINMIYLTKLKIEKRTREIIVLNGLISGSTISLSYILILQYGLIGFGLGWTIPQTIFLLIVVSKFYALMRE